MKKEDKVVCETPTPGKNPTRIDRWKYDAVSAAMLKAIPKTGDGLLFKELAPAVARFLSADDKENLGSLMWYVTTVKLDLEVRGLIQRIPKSSPQRLLRC